MANVESTQTNSPRPSSLNRGLKIALLVAFLLAVSLTAYLTFVSVRDFITSYEMTDLPGITIQEPEGNSSPGEGGSQNTAVEVSDPQTPLQPVSGPAAPQWDGANRVTVLIMGLDYRDWQAGEGPPRTDTMILFTVDPLTKTAGMLSIPRDLWVNIPHGFKPGRINTAYQLGEAFQWPEGGGPGLAMETVEGLLGVPIDYYAQIDFEAFVRFIDEIGGVKVDIPEKIVVDPLGDNNTKTLKPGVQTLPGDLALAYVRVRKSAGDDFGRAQRQQQVVMAIRNQILRFDQLPRLMSNSGVLYKELSAGIRTNLSIDQAIRLAWLASQIPEENIKQGVIGPPDQVTLATAVTSEGNQEVLKPITEKIRELRDEIFTNTGPASPAMAEMSLAELVAIENARVAVYNGSPTPGLAARTTDYLTSLGINVTVTDNAQQALTYTEITFYNGKPYTVDFLVNEMGISPNRIFHLYDPASPVDIEVVLGSDWANSGKLP